MAIWRKLRRLGVAQVLDGLVALPANASTKEQLEWIANEVLGADGEATRWLGRPGSSAGRAPADATALDTRGVEMSHQDDNCSFETMLGHSGLLGPVLFDLARIVHEADLAADHRDDPEAPGLDVLCRSLSMLRGDEVLAVTGVLFDGLHELRRRALLLASEAPRESLAGLKASAGYKHHRAGE